jgi:hypothetical protein
MRYMLLALSLLVCPLKPADAQVSVSIGFPVVDIGIHVPTYPNLVVVPGYPVYYDPRASTNYFFYDGLYFVYQGDDWYASSWYNGPWQHVAREQVPLYVLRVPVRYYRRPPAYFRGWHRNAPPRWGERWGRDWEHQRAGWERWDRRAAPRPSPLPSYQRRYSGERYPRALEQQHSIRTTNYRYEPREDFGRRHYQRAPVPSPAHDDRRDHRSGPRGNDWDDRDRRSGPRGNDRDDRDHHAGPRGNDRDDRDHHAGPRGNDRDDRDHRPGPRGNDRDDRGHRPDPRGHDRDGDKERGHDRR